MPSRASRLLACVLIPTIAVSLAILAFVPRGVPTQPPLNTFCAGPCPVTNIKHVVIIVQENHTFDDHFGRYCTAPPYSHPTSTIGSNSCEAAPQKDPAGVDLKVLTDQAHAAYDPDHSARCETDEIDGGKMDRFATAGCGSKDNVVVADPALVKPYWDLARGGALADRYFQSVVGASSSNDMYLARAGFVFGDNDLIPKGAIGATCSEPSTSQVEYTDTTIGDLLNGAGVKWSFYAEGYQAMVDAVAKGTCPTAPPFCGSTIYPCIYDPSDVPFQYYPSVREKHMRDFALFQKDLDEGTLPAVAYVKALGFRTEHPGDGVTLSAGVAFVTGVVDAVMKSQYRGDTLVLITYDESGGYFDHVAPPPPSAFDGQSYGPRIPMLAVGPFAKKNYVSHVVMEHSSIVKFIEWNWLRGTGQLNTRDTEVNNIGSLLEPRTTGVPVPEH
jgi:phospholipase C